MSPQGKDAGRGKNKKQTPTTTTLFFSPFPRINPSGSMGRLTLTCSVQRLTLLTSTSHGKILRNGRILHCSSVQLQVTGFSRAYRDIQLIPGPSNQQTDPGSIVPCWQDKHIVTFCANFFPLLFNGWQVSVPFGFSFIVCHVAPCEPPLYQSEIR